MKSSGHHCTSGYASALCTGCKRILYNRRGGLGGRAAWPRHRKISCSSDRHRLARSIRWIQLLPRGRCRHASSYRRRVHPVGLRRRPASFDHFFTGSRLLSNRQQSSAAACHAFCLGAIRALRLVSMGLRWEVMVSGNLQSITPVRNNRECELS